ncbi:RICIN domain-containing protein [Microbacterium sp.]|uniref:RICIN domain-containing protein n=1 Tax=Microbacterium sp. TaxID=51671 RepID=UPI0039E5FA14
MTFSADPPARPPRTLRRVIARIGSAVAVVAVVLGGMSAPAAVAETFGVSTMYTPPAAAPTPKVLYPRAITLQNGTMLASFEQYTNGTPVLPIFRSTDKGRTWTRISSVRDTVNGWGLRYQPQLFQLPSAIGNYPAGTIIAAGNSIPNDLSETKLDVYASTDGGYTWSFVSSIARGGVALPNNGETPVWEPFFVFANGKLSAFYSDQRDPAYGQKIVHQTTSDLTTWGAVVNDVTNSRYSDRPGMPVITKLPDGRYMMTYENGGAAEGYFSVYYKFSTDIESWGNKSTQVLRTTDGIVPTGSPYVTWIPSGGPQGTIVVSASSSSDLFLNTSGGAKNTWTRVPIQVSAGYSRSLTAMPDGRTVFVMNAGSLGGNNTVTYGAVDLGSSITSGATYTVANRSSGLVLGVEGGGKNVGAGGLQWTDNGTPDHSWTFERQSDGYWLIRNRNSGLVLGVTGKSRDNGARTLQWSDNGTLDHEWVIVPFPGGGFAISNRVSGKRLEIGNASTAIGAAAIQWEYTAHPCQAWILR